MRYFPIFLGQAIRRQSGKACAYITTHSFRVMRNPVLLMCTLRLIGNSESTPLFHAIVLTHTLGPKCAGGRQLTTTAGQRSRSAHFHAEGGMIILSSGTSVFTETCGQVSLAKFSRTVWLY
jgi:hypothetical protein